MAIENCLKIPFIFVSLNSLHDLSRFEYENGWHRRDSVLNGKLHVVSHVHFADPSITFVVESEFINDWTQSFTRWSALRPKINQNRIVGTEHLGFKRLFCKLCCHDFSKI